jgi:hypothetical protein
LSIATIASKISRCAGRKKSSGPMLVATSSNAAGLMKPTRAPTSRLRGCAAASRRRRRIRADDLEHRHRARFYASRARPAPDSIRYDLFFDDRDFDRRVHAASELHRDVEVAERLQRLVEMDLLRVDGDALLAQRLGDVAAGDGAVQLVLFTDRALDLQRAPSTAIGLGLRSFASFAVRAAMTRFSCSTRVMSPAVALIASPRGSR